MRVALDTNLLAYAEGVNGPDKQEAALALITRLPRAAVVIPAQALGELFNVLVRKAQRSRGEARQAMLMCLLLNDFNLKRLAKRPRSIFGLAFHVR